jgi:peptidoglycan/xylan/chitin deacetylase (PgdA/CDA1 family)
MPVLKISTGKPGPGPALEISELAFGIYLESGFWLLAFPRPMPHPSWIRPCLLGGNLLAAAGVLATRFGNPWAIGGAALVHTGFAVAVMRPQCDWFGPVTTRFETTKRDLWLTIDDGPAGDASLRLGDELAQRGVRATFFVIGEKLARHPHIAARWMAAGHRLANHTQTHPAPLFPWLTRARLRAEIDGCRAVLRDSGAGEPRWFRPPVGLKPPRLHPELAARDLRLVAWNVRACDGIRAEPAAVVRRVKAAARPGAIVLLHEDRPRSVETILRTVDALQEDGYAFTIPSEEALR